MVASRGWHRRWWTAIRTIKIVHTLAWLAVEASMAYVLYAGFTHRSGRRVTGAGVVLAVQTAVFAGNRFRCPLTQLAERLGPGRGSVTDIYLPQRLARSLPAIHAPLIVLAVALHTRNRLRGRGGPTC